MPDPSPDPYAESCQFVPMVLIGLGLLTAGVQPFLNLLHAFLIRLEQLQDRTAQGSGWVF